ncbi:cache domain-containing sensor histidine kinase [Cohnella zeiphila]|uniref:histidine kinase n=1 Tax=Cohnella zeiphila TaxID=2761120 RepID=A0A7X0SRJ0_9BACL|nr:sensor histidine kinase [Cohnella zeiphila]MBB6732558.1 sensor histidine kinase [Cohnella zeiphila]
MIKWLKRLLFEKVSTKLIAMVLSLILLSATFISMTYYGSSVSIIGSHVRASTKQGAKQTADYLSLMLTVGTDMGQQIFRNTRLQEVLNQERQGHLTVDQQFEIKDSVGQTLNNTIYSSSFVRSIYILRENGESWGSGLFNASKVKRYTLSGHEWYSDVVSDKANELWLPLGYDPFSGGGDDTELVLTLVDAFRNLKTKQTEGVILVNLDGQLILDAVQRIQLGKSGTWRVVDPTGQVLISSDSEQWGRPLADAGLAERLASQNEEIAEFQTKLNGEEDYVVSVRMANGWRLVGQVPVKEIIGDIVSLQRRVTMYTAMFLLVALLVGLMFSTRITHPLKELTRQMKAIENNNFKARSRIRSRDEIGRLSLRFNQMAGQIETLIREVEEAGTRKREAEIRALRHQINPHFLYNTLSSIRWMIKLGQTDNAYKGIAALVELMESSMGKASVFTTIRQELELLDKYMVIQRFRYGEGLSLETSAEEETLDFEIPRMLLQPLAENAIFHGLAPRDGQGIIRLDVRRQVHPPAVRIAVADDGAGIEPERLATLLRGEAEENRTGMLGIGLHHVQETIRLYYGPGSGVDIRSEAGRGTIVTLTLAPKEE